MAYKMSIAEIINKIGNFRYKEEKVDFLRRADSPTLRNILILTYDLNKKLLVPTEPPPYRESDSEETHGALFNQARKLKYIVEGFSNPKIKQAKRETIFIEILESVHKEDAKILCQMIQRKPFKGLTAKTINEAYGNLINERKTEV
jgi:hypothetical protein